ncbi:MAG: phosphotransferase [Actinobacteria bacterium]|nr:phosphotransferase [Actinomycetota bacterium]
MNDPHPAPAPVPDDVRAALARIVAPLGDLTGIERLTGGMFATTYRLTLADGTRVVAKTAPADAGQLLRYERDLIRAEAIVYRLAEPYPDLLMPRVLLTDYSRTELPGDVVVASHARGVPADQGPEVTDELLAARRRRLGSLMAGLHALHGDRFGYVEPGTSLRGATWPEAFGRMIDAVLSDAHRWDVDVAASRVRAALVRHADALATVEHPSLVHADLWPGNLFVDPDSGDLTAVIDPERAFWGDPLFDLVGADPFRLGPPAADLLAGYRQAGADLPLGTAHGDARYALCQLMMALVMLVEVAPRGYAGDWLPAHLEAVTALHRSALDRLE